METECDQVKHGNVENVETECDQGRETWKLSVIRGNVETECDQGKRGN